MNSIVIVLIILVILAVLLFVPIAFEYTFFYDGKMKRSFVLRYLFYQKSFSKKKTKSKTVKKEKKPKPKKSISQIIDEVKYYKRVVVYFKRDIFLILKYVKDKTIKIKNLSFDIKFAGKDPMQTGIYTGVVNGAVYNAVAIVDNTAGVDEWSVNVSPDFYAPAFINAKVHCILNTKLVHIIVILIKLLAMFIKYKMKKKEI